VNDYAAIAQALERDSTSALEAHKDSRNDPDEQNIPTNSLNSRTASFRVWCFHDITLPKAYCQAGSNYKIRNERPLFPAWPGAPL